MEDQTVLCGKYILKEKIGSGSFGDVHNGICIQNSETVALKIERMRSGRPQLENEFRSLRHLQGGIGVPRVFMYTSETSYNIMAFELLGQSLESLLKLCRSKLSLKTVLMIADQCISRLEFVHSKSFIHRDIKPENFLIGLGRKAHVIYIVDFGLAKRYIDPGNLKHIKYKEGKNLTGTARYVSVYTHLGIEQSRRDDLESLGYMLIYLLNGTLPWVGIPGNTKAEKYKLIGLCKANKSLEELCYPFPPEFVNYFNYCKALGFEQKPDYAYLKRSFKEIFSKISVTYDYIFDWDLRRKKISRKNLSVSRDRNEVKLASPIKEFNIRRGITPIDSVVKREDSPIKGNYVRKDTNISDSIGWKDQKSFFTTVSNFARQPAVSPSKPYTHLDIILQKKQL